MNRNIILVLKIVVFYTLYDNVSNHLLNINIDINKVNILVTEEYLKVFINHSTRVWFIVLEYVLGIVQVVLNVVDDSVVFDLVL